MTITAMRCDLGGFCSLLVHELRTPLASIVANTELILGGTAGGASAGVRAAVVEVAVAARRLETLANAIRQLDVVFVAPSSPSLPVDLVAACGQAGIVLAGVREGGHRVDADASRVIGALRAAAAWLRAGATTAPVRATLEIERGDDGTWSEITLTSGASVQRRDDPGGLDLLLCRMLVASEGGGVEPSSGGLSMRWPLVDDQKSGDPCRGRGFSA